MFLNFVFWEVVPYWRIPAQHSNQIVSPMRRELLALLLFMRSKLHPNPVEALTLLLTARLSAFQSAAGNSCRYCRTPLFL
jgi:hypothetical protein